jgi:POT family proton-dependent oligopeptide transporter
VVPIISLTWVWLYLSSVIVGAMADSFLGRRKSYVVLLIVYFFGYVLLGTSCVLMDYVEYSTVVIVCGLLMVGTGRGGMNTLVIPLLGDQPFIVKTSDHYGLPLFRLYYWTMNLGIAGGLFVGSYVWQTTGNFWSVHVMSGGTCFLSLIIFLLCKDKYKDNQTKRNIVSRCFAIVKSAIYNKFTSENDMESLAIQPRDWLDWAKIEYETDLVDGLRDVLHIGFIFILFPVYWAVFFEIMNLWITQATQTDLVLSPDAELSSGHVQLFRPLAVVICIPIWQIFMIPICNKLGMNLRPLTRILIGLAFALMATLSSLIVQLSILSQPTILAQFPQYILMGFSEAIVASTLMELTYSESPESMKSIVASMYSCTLGMGHLLLLGIKQGLDFIVDHIIRFGVCASLVAVFSIGLFLLFRNHRYRKESNLQSRDWVKDGLVLYGSDSDDDSSNRSLINH